MDKCGETKKGGWACWIKEWCLKMAGWGEGEGLWLSYELCLLVVIIYRASLTTAWNGFSDYIKQCLELILQ